VIERRLELGQSPAISNRIELRPFSCREANRLPERVRNDQNVGKQDRSIEAESTHRLERDLSRKFRRETKLEKISGLFAYLPIFWQISSSLSHQPNGWRAAWLMVQDIEKSFMHRAVPYWLSY
jgi:hypothetical protein